MAKLLVVVTINLLLVLAIANPVADSSHLTHREAKVSYDNYHVFRLPATVKGETVRKRMASVPVVELTDEPGQPSVVAIRPEDVQAFEQLNPEAILLNSDLGAVFSEEAVSTPYSGVDSKTGLPNANWFLSYHRYDEHIQFIRDLHAALPNNSAVISAGLSYEGRELYTLHIWGRNGKNSKSATVWHGTAHAREWIGTMVGGAPLLIIKSS
jgi:carboxypeptidase A4